MKLNSLKITTFILLVLSAGLPQQLDAQEIVDYFHKKNRHLLDVKVERLNELAIGVNTFMVDDKTNIAIAFYEDGKVYRKDNIYLETLNPEKISFSNEEQAVICKCRPNTELTRKLKKFQDGCVQRHILKNDIMRPYRRINFKIIEENREEFMKIMKELILSAWTYQ